MKIVACYKLVPDEAKISFKKEGAPDLSACEWQIGQYDLCAIEAVARIAEKTEGCQLYALTAGGEIVENSKLKKSVLSRGPHEMIAVKDEKLTHADSYATAQVLAAAIKEIGDVSLVVFGEGSGDVYTQQVGNMVGAILGWNTLNAVNSLELDGDKLLVQRNLEDCVEKLTVSMPAAISVSSDICVPRLASMKEIMKAGKKPSTIKALGDYGVSGDSSVQTVSLLAKSKAKRDCTVVAADDAGIEELALRIRKMI